MTNETRYIKQWFMEKNKIRRHSMIRPEMIVRETAKAVLIDFSDYGPKDEMWIPKSCTMSAEEYAKTTPTTGNNRRYDPVKEAIEEIMAAKATKTQGEAK